MFVIGEKALSSVCEKYETTMQHLHDQGMWNWRDKEIIEEYVYHDNGLLYVFQKHEQHPSKRLFTLKMVPK